MEFVDLLLLVYVVLEEVVLRMLIMTLVIAVV